MKPVVPLAEAHLTPAQRMKLKKEQDALKQAELMKEGAREAAKNYSFAKAKQTHETHGFS